MRDLCGACLKVWELCRCDRRCRLCGCLTNHTTADHQAALEESEARGEDGP